jgi:hypothetical protein
MGVVRVSLQSLSIAVALYPYVGVGLCRVFMQHIQDRVGFILVDGSGGVGRVVEELLFVFALTVIVPISVMTFESP